MQFCTQNPLAGNHDKLRIMQIAAAWISEEYYLPYKEKLNLNFWSSPGSWLLREKIMLNGKNSKKLYVCTWLHGLLLDQLIQICLLQCDFFSIAQNLLCMYIISTFETDSNILINKISQGRNLSLKKIPSWSNLPFLTFPACFWMPIIFSNVNSNCSNLLDLRNLQEQVKNGMTYCEKKLF